MHDLQIPVIGLVLSGGQSSRMGRDKSKIIYHDRPQKLYIFDLLSCFCTKTFVSAKRVHEDFRYPTIIDIYDFGGPLNGILSAMNKFPGFAVLSVPCDMPSVDGSLIKKLLKSRKPGCNAICYSYVDQIEPIFTLWEPSALQVLQQQTDNQLFSPIHFIRNNKTIILSSPKPLTNINTEEDRQAFLKM